jgi:molybdate transport system substrate-binding protein
LIGDLFINNQGEGKRMQAIRRPFDLIKVAVGLGLGVGTLGAWIMAGAVDAGTVTIAATPGVVEAVETVAQAFEAAHPNDRVQIAIASEDEWKNSAMRVPVQIIASDNSSFIDWLDARDVAKRANTGPGVHVPLAVVGSAAGESIATVRDLRNRLLQGETKVAISDPAKTDCGRRSASLLKSVGLTPSSSQVISVKHNAQVIELVGTGKAQFGIVFAPEAIIAKDVRIHAVSGPEAGAPVHVFAVKRGQQDHQVAKRFLAFANSLEAQQVLKARGYEVLQAHQTGEGQAVIAARVTVASQ